MAEVIKVSGEAMLQAVNAYSNQKSAQSTAYQAMKSAVNSLNGVWTGETASNYQSQFEAFYANLSQSEAKMEDAINELRQTKELMEAAEKAGGGVVGALDVGTSPFA